MTNGQTRPSKHTETHACTMNFENPLSRNRGFVRKHYIPHSRLIFPRKISLLSILPRILPQYLHSHRGAFNDEWSIMSLIGDKFHVSWTLLEISRTRGSGNYSWKSLLSKSKRYQRAWPTKAPMDRYWFPFKSDAVSWYSALIY